MILGNSRHDVCSIEYVLEEERGVADSGRLEKHDSVVPNSHPKKDGEKPEDHLSFSLACVSY